MPKQDDDKIISDTENLLEEAVALSEKAEGDFENFDKAIGGIESENTEAQSELDREISEIIKSMEVATDEFDNDLGTTE